MASLRIKNYIIHYLDKERAGEATLELSKSLLEIDEFSEKLLLELHKAITDSDSVKNTKFKEESSNVFSNRLNQYFEQEYEEEDFINFSNSINELATTIEKVPFATGGYYVFADYFIDSKRYVTVAVLRKKTGLNIIKVDGKFKLLDSENLSIDKIGMAFRLNFNLYVNEKSEEEKDNYIVLITTQKYGDVSGYFREWVNAGDLIRSSQNTKSLLEIIETIPLPQDEYERDRYDRYTFQKHVYDYSKSRTLINVYDLSSHFYGEENRNFVMDYAREHDLVIDPEFKKQTRIWRKLITVKASIEGVELSVNYDKLNDDEVKVEDDKIVIYSKKLASKIRSQKKNLE
ncbi:hypothetical protein AV926_14955 [Myroides marinus]|uniref:Nucleoid-associated protein n=1 Tax=Myroides marinus TaxID=703342 RepID=A0A163WQW5_9FLAO|nr:nucleoid-associated protein [Myroides marinus]KZE76706.1 hypothetical protein AV926_14955 [Myroides marinus]